MIIFNLLYIDRFLENSKLYSLYLQAGRKRGPQHWRAPTVIIVKKEDKKRSICFNQKKQLENTSSAEEVDKKIERGEPARTDRAREPVFDTPPLPSPVGEEVPHVPHEHRGALQRREVPARARASEMFQVAPGGHPGTRRPEEFARHVEHRGGDADVAVEVALFFFGFWCGEGEKGR